VNELSPVLRHEQSRFALGDLDDVAFVGVRKIDPVNDFRQLCREPNLHDAPDNA
jgi:hypothetical protein